MFMSEWLSPARDELSRAQMKNEWLPAVTCSLPSVITSTGEASKQTIFSNTSLLLIYDLLFPDMDWEIWENETPNHLNNSLRFWISWVVSFAEITATIYKVV